MRKSIRIESFAVMENQLDERIKFNYRACYMIMQS